MGSLLVIRYRLLVISSRASKEECKFTKIRVENRANGARKIPINGKFLKKSEISTK
jgi:hypothetical protein